MVNSVETAGAQKYLIVLFLDASSNKQLEEIPEQETDEILGDAKALDNVDVICLTYDSADADSFAFIADLRVYTRLSQLTFRIVFLNLILFPQFTRQQKQTSTDKSKDVTSSLIHIPAN